METAIEMRLLKFLGRVTREGRLSIGRLNIHEGAVPA